MTQDASGGHGPDGEGRWSAREPVAGSEAVGVERVAMWAEETRRYRRSPGGWWWLALFLVPAVLAALGLAMDRDSASAPKAAGVANVSTKVSAGPTTSPKPSASGSANQSGTATPSGRAAGAVSSGVFSVSRAAGQVTIAADVPDEASRTALVDAVKAAVGEARIVDHIHVVPGAKAASTKALSGALGVLSGAGDFGLAWDLKTLTAIGNVSSDDAKSAVAAALSAAWPDAPIENDVSVGSAAGTCANLGAQIRVALASTKITFARGSTAVAPESVRAVEDVAARLRSCADAKVTVTGYTDSTGSKSENLALSKSRAAAVGKLLTAKGVAAARLTVRGLADADPVADDDAPGGRTANRRVEITVN